MKFARYLAVLEHDAPPAWAGKFIKCAAAARPPRARLARRLTLSCSLSLPPA